MNRSASIAFLENNSQAVWDIVVIGGGATGLGVALDASLRGYKTLLLEQSDFTKGTSSRSTKLVHGGVRYLAQGDLKLVLEALHERGLLLKNAPHLTQNQSFIVPSFSWWDSLFYTAGLKIYDLLSGTLSLGKSEIIGKARILNYLPTLRKNALKAGIIYHDGQFDDARLGINIAQSCVEQGAHLLNYMQVTALEKNKAGTIDRIKATDLETGKCHTINAKVVINATGVFVDKVLAMDDAGKPPMVRPSQGTHIVLDRSFLPSDYALMIPKTDDGRVLFAVPWHDKIVVGTTDTLIEKESLEPKALDTEVDFILATFGKYVNKQPTRADVLSVFAGLRPLARPAKEGKKTKEISRNHKLIVSSSGLITITGGKWTTFRKMAEDTVNMAINVGRLEHSACTTHHFKIHGYTEESKRDHWLHFYGSDTEHIENLMNTDPTLMEKLHSSYPFVKAEVIWAVRNEMARTVEDILARRIRILFLDAKAAIDMAPTVAKLLSEELNKDQKWTEDQIESFTTMAKGYLLV
jgi:glycerol-3-phosphate dehydrogenase